MPGNTHDRCGTLAGGASDVSKRRYLEALVFAHADETWGEAFFEELALLRTDTTQRAKLHRLTLLEHDMKCRLRALIDRYHLLPHNEIELVQYGRNLARGVAAAPWIIFVVYLRISVAPYLEKYAVLANAATESDKEVLDLFVQHEAAIFRFAQLEEEGNQAASLEEVNTVLQRSSGEKCGVRVKREVGENSDHSDLGGTDTDVSPAPSGETPE